MSTTTEPAFGLKPTTPGEVAKAIAMLVAAVATFLVTALTDAHLSPLELLQGAVIVVGLAPVYLLTGTGPKTIAAVVIAVLQGLIPIVSSAAGWAAVTPSDYAALLVAALAAAGVLVIPNGPKPGPLAVVPAQSPQQARLVQDAIDVGKAAERGDPVV